MRVPGEPTWRGYDLTVATGAGTAAWLWREKLTSTLWALQRFEGLSLFSLAPLFCSFYEPLEGLHDAEWWLEGAPLTPFLSCHPWGIDIVSGFTVLWVMLSCTPLCTRPFLLWDSFAQARPRWKHGAHTYSRLMTYPGTVYKHSPKTQLVSSCSIKKEKKKILWTQIPPSHHLISANILFPLRLLCTGQRICGQLTVYIHSW